MSEGMGHEAAREALEALALDALDASEREAVLAHVAGCDECRRELAALERTAAQLALAASPVPMPSARRDRVRGRLVARAGADRDVDGAAVAADAADAVGETLPGVVPPLRVEPSVPERVPEVVPIGSRARTRPRLAGTAWLAIAASIIAVIGFGGYLRASADRDLLRDALRTAATERASQLATNDSLRAAIGDRDRMIANLTGPDVHVMTLASTTQTPMGRMFWDQQHDAWTLVAHHVPMPKAGRTYQLWLVTPTAKISAGTFMPTQSGEVMMRATYALPSDSLAAVAVTDEPGGGSLQPTTAPLMVAAK
jgi:anti-sigma-K factor RskA